jgi:hypothetical protein
MMKAPCRRLGSRQLAARSVARSCHSKGPGPLRLASAGNVPSRGRLSAARGRAWANCAPSDATRSRCSSSVWLPARRPLVLVLAHSTSAAADLSPAWLDTRWSASIRHRRALCIRYGSAKGCAGKRSRLCRRCSALAQRAARLRQIGSAIGNGMAASCQAASSCSGALGASWPSSSVRSKFVSIHRGDKSLNPRRKACRLGLPSAAGNRGMRWCVTTSHPKAWARGACCIAVKGGLQCVSIPSRNRSCSQLCSGMPGSLRRHSHSASLLSPTKVCHRRNDTHSWRMMLRSRSPSPRSRCWKACCALPMSCSRPARSQSTRSSTASRMPLSSSRRATSRWVRWMGTAPWLLKRRRSPTIHSSSMCWPRSQWQATALFLRALLRKAACNASSPAWVIGVCQQRSPRRSANWSSTRRVSTKARWSHSEMSRMFMRAEVPGRPTRRVQADARPP